MAQSKLTILVNAIFKGAGLKEGESQLKKLDSATTSAGKTFETMKDNAAKLSASVVAVGVAAKITYDTLKQGAALNAAKDRFDALSEAAGTTGDVLLTSMREGTKGLISDAQLVAQGAELLGTGVAKTGGQVERVSKIVGVLNTDLEVLGATLRNNSKLRVDNLGISLERVTEIMKTLQDEGFDGDAFDEAIFVALEEKAAIMGDTMNNDAASIQRMETALANMGNRMLQNAAETTLYTRTIEGLTQATTAYNGILTAREGAEKRLGRAVELGLLPQDSANRIAREATAIGNTNRGVAQDQIRSWEEKAAAMQTTAEIEEAAAKITKKMNDMTEISTISSRELSAIRKTMPGDLANLKEAEKAYFETLNETVRVNDDLLDKERQRSNLLSESEAMVNRANTANAEYFDTLRETEEATAAAIAAYDEYNTRLSSVAGDALPQVIEAQRDEKNELLETASALGITAVQFGLLAAATGDYTEEQIASALETALMKEKIEQLATAIANGETTVRGALDELDQFKQGLADGSTQAGELEGSVRAASDAIRNIPDKVNVKFTSDLSEWNVPGGFSGAPQTATGRVGGVAMAKGGSFVVPPGFPNDSFPVNVQSGEHVQVTPAGQSPGGATVNITIMGSMNPMGTANAVAAKVANVLGGVN